MPHGLSISPGRCPDQRILIPSIEGLTAEGDRSRACIVMQRNMTTDRYDQPIFVVLGKSSDFLSNKWIEPHTTTLLV
jgi:hypothetical protein